MMTTVSRENIIILTVLLCSAMLSAWGDSLAVAAEKATVATIIIQDKSDGISPASVDVKRGDTVVWYNQGKYPVTISVKQRIGIVCSPLVNFNADPAGNYRTGAIPHGSTASLCFIHGGTYTFEVRWLDTKEKKFSAKAVTGSVAVK
jgi:plastocyanin